MDWWSEIPTFEKVFWNFAIPFTLLFIIQTVLTFLGVGGEDIGDTQIDFEGDGSELSGEGTYFPVFTIRNFIIFFTVFGWTGIAASNAGLSKFVTVIISILTGLIVMFIVGGTFYLMTKLGESGNININNAIGSIGEVYLTIPGRREGVGKVQIKIQDSIREIDAMTDGETIKTGELAKVIKILNEGVLLVEKIRE